MTNPTATRTLNGYTYRGTAINRTDSGFWAVPAFSGDWRYSTLRDAKKALDAEVAASNNALRAAIATAK